MRRTLEAIFRHFLKILIPFVCLPIIGAALVYFLVPRTYQSTASVWALQRYFVIGATGLESDLTSSPAETQATALNELLQTRAFALEVAEKTNLEASLDLSGDPNSDSYIQDALYNDISRSVFAVPSAYSLYQISYTNRNPQVAQQVVQAVITYFGSQSLALSVAEGQNLLGSYKAQLADAEKTADAAVTAESKYVQAHQNAKQINDPQYTLLDAKRTQAQANVQGLQSVIDQIEQSINVQGSSVNSLFQVIDPPSLPDRPTSRTKGYILGGGVGVALALLACATFLVILVRRDRGLYSAADLRNVVQYDVVLQLPKLNPPVIALLTRNSQRE